MFIHGAIKVLPLFNANDEKIGTINGRIYSCCNEYKNEFVASFEFEALNNKSYFHFTQRIHDNNKCLYVVFRKNKYWLSKLSKDFTIEYNNYGTPFYYYSSKIINLKNGKDIFIFINDELTSKLVMIEKSKAAKD